MAVTTTTLLRGAPQQAKTDVCADTHLIVGKLTARRVVTIDETCNASYANTQWCADDCKRHWYTRLDYQQIKTNVKLMAKRMTQRERDSRGDDDENESYHNVLLRVYEACGAVPQETTEAILTADEQALLAQLVGKAQHRAGLEKIGIQALAHGKRHCRAVVLDTVLTVQATHRAAASRRTRTQLLRLSCQAVSRPSRVWARVMAQALEASLQQA